MVLYAQKITLKITPKMTYIIDYIKTHTRQNCIFQKIQFKTNRF